MIGNSFMRIALFTFVFFLMSSKVSFAVWSGDFYDPGETFNPECLPSQTNCDVLIPFSFQTSLLNYFFGKNAGNSTMTGIRNTATGYGALNLNTTGQYNTANGTYSLQNNSTGVWNTALGASSMRYGTLGSYSTGIGSAALVNNDGDYNTGVGSGSMNHNTTGTNNAGLGYYALFGNTTGNGNIGIGSAAMTENTTGYRNIAIGESALGNLDITANDGSGFNTAIGALTGGGLVTGVNNTILGANVSISDPALSNNIIIADGGGTQRINVNSAGHVGIGTNITDASIISTLLQLGEKVTDDNGFVYNAEALMVTNQTPTAAATLNDPQNVLLLARQGTSSESYGAAAAFNLSRFENSGTDSKTRLDISLANTSFDPMDNNILTLLSNGNIGMGTTSPYSSGYSLGSKILNIQSSGTNGNDRAAIVLSNNFPDAEGNVLGELTWVAPNNLDSGPDRRQVAQIRVDTQGAVANQRGGLMQFLTSDVVGGALLERMRITNEGLVGIGNASPGYLLHVGDTSIADATVLLRLEDADSACDFTANAGAPTCGSDETLKKNINNQIDNLDKILSLRPVTYNWLTDIDGKEVKHGFIAQEVAKVMPELVTDGKWIDGSTRKFLQTAGMTPYIVGAIQELNANLESLTLPATTENITQTFAERFFGGLAAWLADASNGIGNIFAKTYTAKEKLCIKNTCVTEAQLQTLLQNANVSPTSPSSTPEPAPNPEPVITTDPTPTPTPDPAPIPDPAISPDPTPSPEPAPTPEPTPEITPTPETPAQ